MAILVQARSEAQLLQFCIDSVLMQQPQTKAWPFNFVVRHGHDKGVRQTLAAITIDFVKRNVIETWAENVKFKALQKQYDDRKKREKLAKQKALKEWQQKSRAAAKADLDREKARKAHMKKLENEVQQYRRQLAMKTASAMKKTVKKKPVSAKDNK